MKQFVKVLDKEGACFEYICKALPDVINEKLKNSIFDSPDIWKLIKDQNFITSMNKLESEMWRSFIAVMKNFLDNKRSDDSVSLVQNMLDNYHNIGTNMRIRSTFLSVT